MYKSFKEMPVWKDAMDLAVDIFKISENFPKKEDYGLTSQLRRAALSIPANIAEAYGRKHSLDKINFYFYSRGSVTETQNHIEYGRRVNYINDNNAEDFDKRLNKIYTDLNKIILSLNLSTAFNFPLSSSIPLPIPILYISLAIMFNLFTTFIRTIH